MYNREQPLEQVTPRPPIHYTEVVEWTGRGRAKLDSGATVPTSQIDFDQHWTEELPGEEQLHPDAVEIIRNIEKVVHNYFASEVDLTGLDSALPEA